MKAAFEPILHPPARLQIAAVLAQVDEADFPTIREIVDVSDSVLSKHLSALVDGKFVKLRKETVDGRQKTWAAFTRQGRTAFAGHMQALHELVDAAQQAVAAE